MHNNEMKNYLKDLISEIQEKYNKTLISSETESLEDSSYRLGSNFAYYDILDLIKSQLGSFGYNIEGFEDIAPCLGKEIQKD